MSSSKIINIIGTRPNTVKFINITGKDIVINTGQHFSDELKCKEVACKYNLGKTELGEMITVIKDVLIKEKPDLIGVYGDTRSALAGALVASELNVPLFHCEAGVRLGDMRRPEERIRKLIDSLSNYLFCVNDLHAENLEREDVQGRIYIVGDLHYDRYLQQRPHKGHVLATIHRAENTESKEALTRALGRLKGKEAVLLPLHPRTRKAMEEFKVKAPRNIKIISPVPYLEMQELIRTARLVMTDSGGVAREAWFAGTPVEFIGSSEWDYELRMFGDGTAEEQIREILLKCLK